MTDRYKKYRFLIEISDSDYPPFWFVPVYVAFSIVLGFCFSVFYSPLFLLGLVTLLLFCWLMDWQKSTFAQLANEPDFLKITDKIHTELRKKYDIKG